MYSGQRARQLYRDLVNGLNDEAVRLVSNNSRILYQKTKNLYRKRGIVC